jgi:hypothetical protein
MIIKIANVKREFVDCMGIKITNDIGTRIGEVSLGL